jgi:chemotaxis family two-component system sensor kinase Cph1
LGLGILFARPTEGRALTQLFQNLTGNAIKFPRHGTVPHVQIDCRPTPRAWLFSVTDNGIDTGDQYPEKVFRILQRLHRPQEYRGTEIGLAICQKVADCQFVSGFAESAAIRDCDSQTRFRLR